METALPICLQNKVDYNIIKKKLHIESLISIIRHMHDCDSILEGEKHGPVDFYNCCDL